MLKVRKSGDRGMADHGWLQSAHSFSFGDYDDPQYRGFGNLRVINEDHVAAGAGFAPHGHRNMEIVTYMLSGTLAHKDSMGNVEEIAPGEVQRMSAGTGVRHSEFNPSAVHQSHLLQIWLLPKTQEIEPSYEQQAFSDDSKRGNFQLIVSGHGEAGAVAMHADARIFAGLLDGADSVHRALDAARLAYLHVVQGEVEVNGVLVGAGDAVMLRDEPSLQLGRARGAHVLLFDLAP